MDLDENVDDFIKEIEKKYSTCNLTSRDDFDEQLCILSEEFDALGFSALDLQAPTPNLLQAVVNNTFLVIQLYRKTLNEMTEININQRTKDVKSDELQKTMMGLKTKLKSAETDSFNLERKLSKLLYENEELSKKVVIHNKEIEKLKQYHKSKQNQLSHYIKNLENENHHLKEICGKDFDKYFSKEEKFLKILKTYKHKEVEYKDALKKLEDNNNEIMNEILNLRHELAMAYLK